MRYCTVKGEKAIFHAWEQISDVIPPSPMRGGHSGGTIRYTAAIIEREDGTVATVEKSEIVFLDTKTILSNLERKNRKLEERNNILPN